MEINHAPEGVTVDYLAQRYGPIIRQFAAIYPDDDALQAQLKAVSVTAEDWDINRAGGHLKFETPPDTALVDLDTLDAWTNDADGTPIDIILHFVGGRMNWGEWFRVDGQPIETWPPPSIRGTP